MAQFAVRLVMVLVGLSLLALYLLAAVGTLVVLQWLVAAQPSPLVTLAAILVGMAVVGYVSYRAGTARLLADLDAVAVSRRRAPALHRRLDRLVARMAVDRPTLCVADIGAPNALSIDTHRGGTIVLDRRLLGLLTGDELEGILAHELAHAESNDSRLKTLAASAMQSVVGVALLLLLPVTLVLTGLARAIAWARGSPTTWERTVPGIARRGLELAVLVLLSVLTLALLAHSRRREFAADRRAAEVTGDPLALARALHKIDRAANPRWSILTPLYVQGDEEGPLTRLLSTHPPVEERIEQLLQRSRRGQFGA